MMRNHDRRSFTVEVRSGSRHHPDVIIPSRTPSIGRWAVRGRRQLDPWAALSAAKPENVPPGISETRRILPNLMVPEVPPAAEPEVARATPSKAPPHRRGRPPKLRLDVASVTPEPEEMNEAKPIQEPSLEPNATAKPPEPHPAAPTAPAAAPRIRGRKEASNLRPGERWKRRLPRACW